MQGNGFSKVFQAWSTWGVPVSDFFSCQIFVPGGRAKRTHAVVYHDLIIPLWNWKWRENSYFKPFFVEIGAVCEMKTAVWFDLGTDMEVPAWSVGQPTAGNKTHPDKSGSGKLHLQAVCVRKQEVLREELDQTNETWRVEVAWRWNGSSSVSWWGAICA